MKILPLYASILALLFVALSVRTLRLRHRLKIGIGDAGNTQMLRAMRVHSNFAEYVPLSLLLLYLVPAGASCCSCSIPRAACCRRRHPPPPDARAPMSIVR